jgi:hypothetical protein
MGQKPPIVLSWCSSEEWCGGRSGGVTVMTLIMPSAHRPGSATSTVATGPLEAGASMASKLRAKMISFDISTLPLREVQT